MKQKQLTYSIKDLEYSKPTLLQRLLKTIPPPPPTKEEERVALQHYLDHDHFEIDDIKQTNE